MELRDYLRILRKGWGLIVALVVLGGLAGFGYASLTPPSYTATAKVFVSTSGASSAAELQQGVSFTLQRVQTYSELVQTSAVLEPAIDRLDLPMSVNALRSRVSASSPPNTTVITISASDDDAETAAAIATAVSRELIVIVEDWETTAGMTASPVALKVAQEAEVPGAPSSPNTRLNVAMGIVAGLFVGIGLAFLRAALDTKVHGSRDIKRITDLPILGTIVYDATVKSRPLAAQDDGHRPLAEGYRTLRTNLQFIEVGRAKHSIMFTSSVPHEGKSTTALNLGLAMASVGAKVLLVEADMRRPKLARYMGVESGVGLTDVLIGRASVDDVCQPWGADGLHILACGAIPPNPSELLASTAMQELALELEDRFDAVIYDAPPLLPVTDGAVLAQVVDRVLVVVASGRAHQAELHSSLDALANVGCPASGVVLTMVPASAAGYGTYGYRRYDYAVETEELSLWGRLRRRLSREERRERFDMAGDGEARAGKDAAGARMANAAATREAAGDSAAGDAASGDAASGDEAAGVETTGDEPANESHEERQRKEKASKDRARTEKAPRRPLRWPRRKRRLGTDRLPGPWEPADIDDAAVVPASRRAKDAAAAAPVSPTEDAADDDAIEVPEVPEDVLEAHEGARDVPEVQHEVRDAAEVEEDSLEVPEVEEDSPEEPEDESLPAARGARKG